MYIVIIDAGNQVVCTVGQTQGHSSLDHTMRRADVRRVEQFVTTGYPIYAPQWPHSVCVGLAWLDRISKKPSVKADLLISSNCVTG